MKVQVIEVRAEIHELLVQKDRPKYAGRWHSVITFLDGNGKVSGIEMRCHERERDAVIYLRMLGFYDEWRRKANHGYD